MSTRTALLIIAVGITLISIAAAAYLLWRSYKQPTSADDLLLNRTRENAHRAISHLNRTVQESQFETGTSELLDRLTQMLERLGDNDHAVTERNTGRQQRILLELLIEYQALAAGRTSDTGMLLVHPNDGSKQQYTSTVYRGLAMDAVKIAAAILDAHDTRDQLTALCDEVELAITQNADRNAGLRAQAEQVDLSLKELAKTGYATTLLRQQLAAARGRLTKATAEHAEANYRTAHAHLKAAEAAIARVQTAAEDLPRRMDTLQGQLVAFEMQADGTTAALAAARSLLNQLRRRYNADALAQASKDMATAHRTRTGFAGQVVKLRGHLEKYEVNEAEEVAAALDTGLRLVREMPARIQAHRGSLEYDYNQFVVEAAAKALQLAQLARRIDERQGNQRRHLASVKILKDRVAAANAAARANPVAALAEIKAIGTNATKLEARSATAHAETLNQ